MRASQLILPLAAAGAEAGFIRHRHITDHLVPRGLVGVDPNGLVCPAFPVTTIELQPVYYSELFPYNTVIYPFRDGNPFTVTGAPTTVIVASTLTRTIGPTDSFNSSVPLSSTVTTAAGSAGQTAATTFSGPAGQSGATTSPPPGGQPGATTSLPPGSQSGATPSLPSRGQSAVTTNSASQLGPSATSSASQTALAPLSFGQGVPGGTLTNIPGFIVLAFTNSLPPAPRARAKRDAIDRRQSSGSSPIVAVDLAQSQGQDLPGGVSEDNCDFSTPFFLRNGVLVNNDRSIGKDAGATTAEVRLQISSTAVNLTFSVVDGELQWDADVGFATFYNCGGTIFAGFPSPPSSNCIALQVGAIAGSACIDRVSRTRAVNPAFGPPTSGSSSTTSSQSTLVTVSTLPGAPSTEAPPAGTATTAETASSQGTGVTGASQTTISGPLQTPTATGGSSLSSAASVQSQPTSGLSAATTTSTQTTTDGNVVGPDSLSTGTTSLSDSTGSTTFSDTTIPETTTSAPIESSLSESTTSTSSVDVATSSADSSTSFDPATSSADASSVATSSAATSSAADTSASDSSSSYTVTSSDSSSDVSTSPNGPSSYTVTTSGDSSSSHIVTSSSDSPPDAATSSSGDSSSNAATFSSDSTTGTAITSSSDAATSSNDLFTSDSGTSSSDVTSSSDIATTASDSSSSDAVTSSSDSSSDITSSSDAATSSSDVATSSSDSSSADVTSSSDAITTSSDATTSSSDPVTSSTDDATSTSATTSEADSSSSTMSTASSGPSPRPPPDNSCSNQGVGYAIQAHNFANDDPPTYSNANPIFFKSDAPSQQGTTNIIGFSAVGTASIYGGAPIDVTDKAVNQRGYLYAALAGDYTFSITSSDDISFLWLGSSAYSGYTRANAFISQASGVATTTRTFTLTAGQYLPIRFLTVNDQNAIAFNIRIERPDGETVLDGATFGGSDYIVQFSCDGTSGPAYPNFGNDS